MLLAGGSAIDGSDPTLSWDYLISLQQIQLQDRIGTSVPI